MEQIEILSIIRRYITMIIVLVIITTVAGYAFTFILPNQYTAPALVLVRPQQTIRIGDSKNNKEFLDFPIGSGSAVETASKTYIEIMKSPALIADVVRQLGLDKKRASEDAKTGSFSLWIREMLALLKYGEPLEADTFTKAVDEITAGLKLEATPETYVFELKFSSSDPALAAEVTNTTAKTLIKFINEVRMSESQHRLEYLKIQRQQSQERLDNTRAKLEKFKEEKGIFLPEKEYEAKLKVIGDLETALARAEQTLVGSQDTLLSVSLGAQRAKLLRLIVQHKEELVPLPALERQLKQLDQDARDAGNAYEIIDKEYEETMIREAYALPEIRMVSAAVPPDLPSSPKRAIIAGASLLTGLVVAVGIALLREYRNRRMRTIEQIEDVVGVRVLGTVPRIPRRIWLRA